MESTLTGHAFLDLLILEQLDGISLGVLKGVDDYTKYLYEGEQLWINKIIDQFGSLAYKPSMKAKERYIQLTSYPRSTGGANLAIMRNDEGALSSLIKEGCSPDVNHKSLKTFNPNTGSNFVRISDEFLAFCQSAEFGPQVTGRFEFDSSKFRQITRIEGTRFKDLLYFIHPLINGQPNPLYRIVYRYNLEYFMKLHAAHAKMIYHDANNVNRASGDMRIHLKKTFEDMIDDDVKFIEEQCAAIVEAESGNTFFMQDPPTKEDCPIIIEQAGQLGQYLKQLIDNPHLMLDSSVHGFRIFNPNRVTPSGLIRIGSVQPPVEFEEVEALREQVAQAFHLLPGITPDNSLEKITQANSDIIRMALHYAIE